MFHKEKGSALAECALVLPLLAALVFGTIELSRLFGLHQTLLLAVRESADLGYRSCSALGTTGDCLANMLVDRQLFLTGELPGAELMVSTYRYDSASGTITRSGIYPAEKTKSGYTSRVSAAQIKSSHPFLLGSDNTVISVAEVFYPRTRGMRIGSILSFDKGVLYEVAIF